MTLYELLLSHGVEVDHHESDLYAPNVGIVRACADSLGVRGFAFTCQRSGEHMLEFPFAFDPFWRKVRP